MNWRDLRNLDRDDLLNLVGLQSRRETSDWMVPTLAAFGVGVLVGAGIGLMMAPKPGAELRDDLRNKLMGGAEAMASGSYSGTGSSVGDNKPNPIPPRSL